MRDAISTIFQKQIDTKEKCIAIHNCDYCKPKYNRSYLICFAIPCNFFEIQFYNSLLADYRFTCMTEHIDFVTANRKDINPFFKHHDFFQRHNLILYLQHIPSTKSIGSISYHPKNQIKISFKNDD